MFSCQQHLLLLVSLSLTFAVARIYATNSEPAAQFVVIAEDVIPDIENTTQKVIRVNPLDLPSKADHTGSMDSTLFNIQTIRPRPLPQRKYVNSKEMRRAQRTQTQNALDLVAAATEQVTDTPIIRALAEPKPLKPHQRKLHKQLHFLYEQADLSGDKLITKTMPVHVAPGAYPVYYAVAKTNGRFGKYPIKGFRTQAEFMKYLLKTKVAAPPPSLVPIDFIES